MPCPDGCSWRAAHTAARGAGDAARAEDQLVRPRRGRAAGSCSGETASQPRATTPRRRAERRTGGRRRAQPFDAISAKCGRRRTTSARGLPRISTSHGASVCTQTVAALVDVTQHGPEDERGHSGEPRWRRRGGSPNAENPHCAGFEEYRLRVKAQAVAPRGVSSRRPDSSLRATLPSCPRRSQSGPSSAGIPRPGPGGSATWGSRGRGGLGPSLRRPEPSDPRSLCRRAGGPDTSRGRFRKD